MPDKKLCPPTFSDYAKNSLQPSPVAQMTADFASTFRDDIDINLGVGYVNEETIPSGIIAEEFANVLKMTEEHRMPLNYGGPQGSANLIRAIRDQLAAENNGLTKDIINQLEIIIGANGATSILDALAEIFAPGIVITADPYYYIYCNTLKRKSFEIITVPEDNQGMPPQELDRHLTNLGSAISQVRFIYIVTINNPSGVALSNERREELLRVVEKHSRSCGKELPLIFDCAYDSLNHSMPERTSALGITAEIPVFEISTYSKVFAPALRIGYITGRKHQLLELITQKMSDIGFSNSLVMQETTARLIRHHLKKQRKKVNSGYRCKAQVIRREIDRQLAPWLERLDGGEGGFYFYLTFKNLETCPGSDFYNFLTRSTGNPALDNDTNGQNLPKVVYIPGEFCVNPDGEMVKEGRRQLRISYGFEESEKILQAISIMAQACEYSAVLIS